jgi:hypothetical protein
VVRDVPPFSERLLHSEKGDAFPSRLINRFLCVDIPGKLGAYGIRSFSGQVRCKFATWYSHHITADGGRCRWAQLTALSQEFWSNLWAVLR